jgi:DNA-binding MarR family transcriptional regulator
MARPRGSYTGKPPRKSPPAVSANEILRRDAVTAVWRAADRLKREFAAIIEPRGITLQQHNVLRILRGAGQEGLPTLTIAESMIERAPGITRLIDRLENKGLITRERHKSNRRQVLCKITPEGLRLLASLDPLVDAANLRIFAHVTDEQLQTLTDALSV